jgi:hypothetical protein
MEMKAWRTICDQLPAQDLPIIGSVSIVSVTDDPGLQVLVDSSCTTQQIMTSDNSSKIHPENGNSFIIIDQQYNSYLAAQTTNPTISKMKAYLVSMLNGNPYVMKERSKVNGNVMDLIEQDYHVLEVYLFHMKSLACNINVAGDQSPQLDFMRKLIKQLHDLSWLTVTPSRPFRETYLPAHLKLLEELVCNSMNYYRNKALSTARTNN